MTPDELCASLIIANGAEFESLRDQASALPECLVWILDHSARTLTSSPAEAIHAAGIALWLANHQNNQNAAAIASRTRAQGLRALGQHAEALANFEAAAESARLASDELLVAQVQIGAIDSSVWLGQYPEAVALSNRLLADFRRLGALQDAGRVLVNLGNVYYRQDRYHDALACYEEAAETLSSSGDAVAAAIVDFSRANIFSELLQSDKALALFNAARETFDQNSRTSLVAMCDFNIGVLYHGAGQYSAALAAQQRAIAHFSEHNQSLEVAKCRADMADVYRMLNLRTEALEAYDSAIAVFNEIPLDYERARAQARYAPPSLQLKV